MLRSCRKDGVQYTFCSKSETVTTLESDGFETCETVSKGLAERLAAQLGPNAAGILLLGSAKKEVVLSPL